MDRSSAVIVRGKEGLYGTLVTPSPLAQSSTALVVVQLENGQQIEVPAGTLVLQDDGSYYLPLSLAEIEQQRRTQVPRDDERIVIPVIQEALDVQKRVIETGKVRITKVVHEQEALVDEPLLHEEVNVERVPVDRIVDSPLSVRYEGETLIIPILEEEVVVEKRLRLKEELRITKRQVETHQPRHVTLRQEEARVERISTPEQTKEQSNDQM